MMVVVRAAAAVFWSNQSLVHIVEGAFEAIRHVERRGKRMCG